jgi:hypothetical protein
MTGALGIATLVSWLITEGLGAYMLRTWIASGGMRRRRARADGVPQPVIFGHAGLAFTGLAGWVSYLVTGSPALAWLAIGLLFPAIGLGLSTVTVWTPYPARRAGAVAESPAGPPGERPTGEESRAPGDDLLPGVLTDEMLARALTDEPLTTRLVDDLVASMLAVPPPAAREPNWHLEPLIPAAHGVAAMTTFTLAVLAAVVPA